MRSNEQGDRKPGNSFNLIRLSAAMLVIFSHSYDLSDQEKLEPLRIFSRGYMSLGTFAVLVFFSLSGYLIAKSYIRADDLPSYLRARALRIYPGLFCVIIVTCLVLGPLATNRSFAEYFSDPVAYLYLLNIFSTYIYFQLPGVFESNHFIYVNGSIWSLPYEILCYSIVAFVGEGLKKRIFNSFLMFGICLFLFACIGIPLVRNVAFFSIFFAMGAVLYLARNLMPQRAILAIISAALIVVVIASGAPKHTKDACLIMLLPYLVIYLANLSNRLESWTRRNDISYGLYIYGWPSQQVVLNDWQHLSPFQLFIASAAVASLLAFASWHLIERRALKYK